MKAKSMRITYVQYATPPQSLSEKSNTTVKSQVGNVKPIAIPRNTLRSEPCFTSRIEFGGFWVAARWLAKSIAVTILDFRNHGR